jgi:hypothetical protein
MGQGTYPRSYTEHTHACTNLRPYIQELVGRRKRYLWKHREASERRQNKSWDLADAESTCICGIGEDSIKLLEEAESCQLSTLH